MDVEVESMPRGGRRPGAGAPKGNMNALKHGRRSRQLAEVCALLASDPDTRNTLLALADRHDLQRLKAIDVATEILGKMIVRGLKRGADRRLIVLPPIDDGPSIEEEDRPAEPEPAGNPAESPTFNQRTDTIRPKESENRYENPSD
jgi:hypothetical protein